jgi:copper chaperone CopZ
MSPNLTGSPGAAPQAGMTSTNRGRIVMAMVGLLVLPLALVTVALASSERRPAISPRGTAPSGAAKSAVVSIDLHRPICGDCCVGNLWKSVGGIPGVRDIDAKVGDQRFVVYYDPAALDPSRILAVLAGAGDAAATVVPSGGASATPSTERRWVRPVMR